MMHMTFYWSNEVTLLVGSWQTSSWTSYAFSLLACFLAAAFYQFMEDCRLRLKIACASSSSSSSTAADGAAAPTPTTTTTTRATETPLLRGKASVAGGKWTAGRVAGGVLFGVNAGIGYLLMLAVMSFNGGVFLSIVCGLGVGYLVFRGGGEEDIVMVAAGSVEENTCACA